MKIAKWSEAKDGLRIGLHIVSGDWSVGGKVRAEVWLHNAGGKDLDFTLAAQDAPAKAGADAKLEQVKVPDDEYVKSGFPADELVGEGMMWNDVGDGLLLGYRITGDEWRILGKDVKVELWVQNPGDKNVKFQLNMRPDIGLRMKLKDSQGRDHNSYIWPNDTPPLAEHRLLPPGHALKVKEFTVSLLWPENDVSGIKGHFFAVAPGAYTSTASWSCRVSPPRAKAASNSRPPPASGRASSRRAG